MCVCVPVLKQQKPQQVPMAQQPQALLQLQNNIQTNWSNKNAGVNSNIASQIEAINAQQLTLQEQIRQSEQNLSAQQSVSSFTSSSSFFNEVEKCVLTLE